MDSIILWCNTNLGFVTAILSVCTCIISIIAIIVSIRTARLPYKKRLKLSYAPQVYVIAENHEITTGYKIIASNIGNRDLYLKFVGLLVKTDLGNLQLAASDKNHGVLLKPAQSIEIEYKLAYLVERFLDRENDTNDKIYMYAEDSEGKSYEYWFNTTKNICDIYAIKEAQ